MIARLVWWAALAGIALLAGAAQLDRAARREPRLATLVPAPFQGFAAEQLAAAAAADGGPQALQRARRLIAARPIPAEHLRLLAQAASLERNAPLALAALEEATRRGWRDPVTQLAAGQAALLEANHAAAMQRIGALYATGALGAQRDALLAELLAEEAGRAAFARYLASAGNGREAALRQAVQTLAPPLLAKVLADAEGFARSTGTPLPCDRLRQISAGFADQALAASALPERCA